MDYRFVLLILIGMFAIFPIIFFAISKNNKHIRIVFTSLAILYSMVVCVGVFTNIQLNKMIRIISFQNIEIKTFNFQFFVNNVQDFVINILMFVPLGFLLMPIFNKFAIIKTTIIGLSFAIFIEVMQLILPIARSPQLSDIILNSLSCVLGIICFILLKIIVLKFRTHKKKTI